MTDTPQKITKASLSELRVRNTHGNWARLLWEESTGWVIVLSSHGNWSYCWSHIGPMTLQKFLAGLSIDYVAGKFLGDSAYVYNAEDTIKYIRRTICEYRREGLLTAEEASNEWELVDKFSRHWGDFRWWCEESSLEDAPEMMCKSLRGSFQHFWSRLWEPLIVPALKSTDANVVATMPLPKIDSDPPQSGFSPLGEPGDGG